LTYTKLSACGQTHAPSLGERGFGRGEDETKLSSEFRRRLAANAVPYSWQPSIEAAAIQRLCLAVALFGFAISGRNAASNPIAGRKAHTW
jgi:hypothetical protein